ncbi:hypothetical protein AMAG_04811 [Allomyces macrogynus ATCC 38327]|uniref:Uncharacterized protein n=1 Tax=Allomyces macrogynus (strain ATCC 38327) TaxID=578462 RepID=A0A0L0S6D6_ALLM3|nr:hypothetical protein AMAG_04811 [Allomyces macrogynus ATCC 38327]|eukprot:KNE57980.1 hypothetical protein AMAG_04811 [Allomyces macrogynus ATCC 38327]
MPYGADPFELVCHRCRFDKLLRAMRTKDRTTLATLPATPFVGVEVTYFGTETVQHLGFPARALHKMPFDTVYDKNTKWAAHPERAVQLACYACTGSREPMDPFKTEGVEAKAKAQGKRATGAARVGGRGVQVDAIGVGAGRGHVPDPVFNEIEF